MANTLTNTDVYTIINAMSEQMYGDAAMQAIDATTFATVGENMLRTGYESTLNALSTVIGQSLMAIRPYRAKFNVIMADNMRFGQILRKISYFSTKFEASEDWNTDLNAEQLKDGSVIDHYKIKKQYPLEINFCGNKVLQTHVTRFRKALKQAFHSESDFAAFYEGLAVEVQNNIETKREAEARLLLLNHIAAVYNGTNANMKVNLTKGFNDENGTTYTTAELLGAHYSDFLAYFVGKVKKISRLMEDRNTLFHLTPSKTDDTGAKLILNRHTPRELQKLVLNENMIIDAETKVLPAVFNDEYLKLGNYEGTMYWQNPTEPFKINIKPNTIDLKTGQSADAKAAVVMNNVVGVLFDRDALNLNIHAEDVITTPVNAAGDYYNIYYHWAKNYNDDLTENSVIFYMEDETVSP